MGYFDLVVFIGVLAAAAVLLPSALNWNHMAFSAQVAQVEAGQLATITDAALQYEYGNSATLEAPNSSHAVTVAQLIAQGYLPSGTRATDSFGNTISVLFNADGSGNVTGYVIDQGQKVYTDLEAGQLTLALGDRGGAVPAALLSGQHPNTIYGSGGTWQAPAPAGVAAGSIEVEVEPNATQEANDSRFLWRVAAPNAADNTMATPLILGAIETVGNSCTPGSISSASNGDLLECPNTGAWTPISGHWRSPVATYAALPGSGNNDGDVRLTEDTDRAFAWNGGSWQALAVDQNGNLTVPNQLTAENGQVSTWMGCDGHAGMSIGEINAISEPTCGAGSVGFDLGNSSTGVDTTVFNQNGLQIWNSQYGTMFHVDYQGNVSGPGYSIGTASSWGINPNFGNGWAMVTSVNGGLNAQPEQAAGSIHANDYFDRASGEWFSQVANQVNNQQSEINSQQGQINNLNNEYGSQQGQINSINSNLNNSNVCSGSPYAAFQTICSEIASAGGSYVGAFGPATLTSQEVCGYQYEWIGYRYIRVWTCWYNTGPASASGTANNSGMNVDGAGSGLFLPSKPLLISVTGLVGSENGGEQGANWGGLTTTCTGNGVGASILAYVNTTQVADISITKTGQPDYQTWVVSENTATFVVPAGQSFSIQANNTCGQFRGVIWAL
jgi:hypothetical protein